MNMQGLQMASSLRFPRVDILFIFCCCLLFSLNLFKEASGVVIDKEQARAACRNQGFDVDSLLCGTCSRLQDITSPAIGQSCLQCCDSPYDKAKLSLTHAAVMQNPGLNEFMTNRKGKFGKAFDTNIQMDREERAVLTLFKQGEQKLTMRVTHWSANDLEDYIAQYFPKVA